MFKYQQIVFEGNFSRVRCTTLNSILQKLRKNYDGI